LSENDGRVPDLDDRAYSLVDAALREDPGFVLPPGFAARVALRAVPPRRLFHWFEYVIVPALLALPIFVLPTVMGIAVQGMLAGVAGTLVRAFSLFPRFSVDGLIYAGFSLAFTAVADRLLRRRMQGGTTRLMA
jgi:hypothetical protein